MRLAIDIDDTVADFMGAVERQFPGECAGLDKSSLKEMYPGRDEEIDRIIRSAEFHGGLAVVPGARGALWKLLEDGHAVYYVTARREELMFVTIAWLRDNGFPFSSDYLHVVGREPFSKSKTYRHLDVGAVVDDYPAALKEAYMAGAAPIIFDRPWNQDLLDWTRMKNWEEIHGIAGMPEAFDENINGNQ